MSPGLSFLYAHTSRLVPIDSDKALVYLREALEGGFGLAFVGIDADLDPLRHLPAFRRLAEGARLLR